jgi:hypothetical protein
MMRFEQQSLKEIGSPAVLASLNSRRRVLRLLLCGLPSPCQSPAARIARGISDDVARELAERYGVGLLGS